MSRQLTRCDAEGVPLLVQQIRTRRAGRFTARLFNGCTVDLFVRPEDWPIELRVVTLPEEVQRLYIEDYVKDNYQFLMDHCIVTEYLDSYKQYRRLRGLE